MNILLTGGAGFIGFYLSKKLHREGHQLTVIDNLSRNKMDEEFRQELRGAFQEDVDILAAQQMNMDRHTHNPKAWVDITVDGPGLTLRRMLAEEIAAEAATWS